MGEAIRKLAEPALDALEAAIRARAAIRVTHGTPHVFPAERLVRHADGTLEWLTGSVDHLPAVPPGATVVKDAPLGRFRSDKLGTGEGAQMYGPGHYTAERDDVAEEYRRRLAGPGRDKALAVDGAPAWHKSKSYDPTDHDHLGHIPDAMHEARLEMAVSELPPEARDLANKMIGEARPGEGWPDHWEPMWRRIQALAPDFDLNTITDLAPARKYNKLRRGMLELYARASYNKPGPEGVARIRQSLADTLENYDRMKASEINIPDSTRYDMQDAADALYALDHYGDRLSILPPVKPGAKYEAAILGTPDEFLHWDLPMHEQSPSVRRAFGITDEMVAGFHEQNRAIADVDARLEARRRELGVQTGRNFTTEEVAKLQADPEMDRLLDERTRLERRWMHTFTKETAPWEAYQITTDGEINPSAKAGDWIAVRRDIAGAIDVHGGGIFPSRAEAEANAAKRQALVGPEGMTVTGKDAWYRAVDAHGGRYTNEAAVKAAELLREKGVGGIRYYDQGSRFRAANEAGTHNYVVFDDDRLSIMRQFGLAGLMVGGAGAYGQAGAGDTTVQHAGPGRKAIEEGARTLGGLFADAEPAAAEALKDVALPGLEAVRETENKLPEFEAPFSLTSPVAAPSKGKQGSLLGAAVLAPMASHAPTNDYDYQAANAAGVTGPDATGHWPSAFKRDNHPRLIVGGFDTRTGTRVPGTPQAGPRVLEREGWAPEDAARMGAGGLDAMPSHGLEQRIRTAAAMRPMSSHAPAALNAGDGLPLGRPEKIGPAPAPAAPRPYITPPGLFDKNTGRLGDFLATPAKVGDPQRFPLDEAIELSGVGDPSQHMPAGTLGAAAMAFRKPAKATLEAIERDIAEGRAMRAYHGSPHKFSLFKTDHIGTGQGAATFGHGLYFAENPATAEHYRETLAGETPMQSLKVGDRTVGVHNDWDYNPKGTSDYENIQSSLIEDLLVDQATLQGLPPDRVHAHAIGVLDAKIRGYRGEWPEGVAAAEKLRADLSKRGAVKLTMGKRPGAQYEVAIKAPPDTFLQWDRPLSEQSERVQRAVGVWPDERERALAAERDAIAARAEQATGPDRKQIFRDAVAAIAKINAELEPRILGRKRTGRYAWEAAVRAHGDDAAAASATLRGKGLNGIRYLDQDSRAAGGGTHNFVVFDDKIVDILKRYGLAGLMVGGGAAAAGHTQDRIQADLEGRIRQAAAMGAGR